MRTLETLRESLPGYARDLQLNLGSVLTVAGAPGLTERQIWAVALAAASASRNATCRRWPPSTWTHPTSMPLIPRRQ
jgi:alkyl hydroperoxide reductase subunit D